jgi:hypothetical protein
VSFNDHFPASAWLWRTLTGRTARRVYMVLIIVLAILSSAFRVRSYILTRKMHAVIAGLSKVRIDQTTEDEVVRVVPYLVRSKYERSVSKSPELGDVETGLERDYYAVISNEADWMPFELFAERFARAEYSEQGHPRSWVLAAANLLGYRYVGFGAHVTLLNGKVSAIGYGIANDMISPSLVESLVWVRSAHAFWAPWRRA